MTGDEKAAVVLFAASVVALVTDSGWLALILVFGWVGLGVWTLRNLHRQDADHVSELEAAREATYPKDPTP